MFGLLQCHASADDTEIVLDRSINTSYFLNIARFIRWDAEPLHEAKQQLDELVVQQSKTGTKPALFFEVFTLRFML